MKFSEFGWKRAEKFVKIAQSPKKNAVLQNSTHFVNVLRNIGQSSRKLLQTSTNKIHKNQQKKNYLSRLWKLNPRLIWAYVSET